MGKNNRRRLATSSTTKRSKPSSTLKPNANSNSNKPTGITKSKSSSTPKKPLTKQQLSSLAHNISHPTLPFSPSDKILCIGEGDLSFARSLIEHHACEDVTATVLEGEKELRGKYEGVGGNIDWIFGREGVEKADGEGGKEEGKGNGGENDHENMRRGQVKFGVDAMKMKPFLSKKERDGGVGVMDRIFFNFPHVGGKTKDVNRQVRYNQELLVAFFRTAIPSLSPRHGSSIIVTLFEGEPYTLWNIRDLGRHAGLAVEQSFRFQASAYPGYKHARTIGDVKGDGGWKGEDRKARSFVFVRKGEGPVMGTLPPVKKKVESSDDEEEDDDGEGIFGDEDEDVMDGHDEEIGEDEGFRQG